MLCTPSPASMQFAVVELCSAHVVAEGLRMRKDIASYELDYVLIREAPNTHTAFERPKHFGTAPPFGFRKKPKETSKRFVSSDRSHRRL
jgi:hypothetical protein